MATNLTTAVIRGKTYDKRDDFWCQATLIGNSNSLGTGYEIATLKIGDHCRFLYYNDEGVPYPYCVAKFDDTPEEADVLGWFTEDIFPDHTAPTYTITYNGNADEGEVLGGKVPESQVKTKDVELTLSSDVPTREGYAFAGWRAVHIAYDTDGSSLSFTIGDFQPGDKYIENYDATLYAIWSANIKYHANEINGFAVENMPEDAAKELHNDFVIPNIIPTMEGYRFIGWALTEEDADADVPLIKYTLNDINNSTAVYSTHKPLDLYAVWAIRHDDPVVNITSVARCDAEGNATVIGRHVKVEYEYTVDEDLEVASVSISHNGINEDVDTTVTSHIIGGSLDVFKEYTIVVKVTDSVGIVGQASYVLAAETYKQPEIIDPIAMRTNEIYEKDNNGMYGKIVFDWDIDDMNGNNSVASITVNYRELGSNTEFDKPAVVNYDATGASKTCIVTLEAAELSTDKQYEFLITLTDQVSSVSEYVIIPHSFFTLKFKAGGNGVAIGKDSTADGFEVAMESRFLNDVYINGRKYAENQILWRGYSYMSVSANGTEHTAQLSQPVSAQPHGIVLVFSHYDRKTSTADDHSWSTHFVPKVMVGEEGLDGEGGHTFLMAINAALSTFGAKYLRILDNMIIGHESNGSEGTAASGITFTNNDYVLRYVIGV